MPSDSAAQTNPILSGIAVGYSNAQHVGTRIFPIYPATEVPARVPKFGKESFRLVKDTATVDGGGTERTFEWTTISIDADGHMQQTFVPSKSKASPAMRAMINATKFVADGISLNREKAIYDLCADAATFTQSETPGTKWGASLTVDILGDVQTWRENRALATGTLPNILVLAPGVWQKVRVNTPILNALGVTSNRQYGTPAKVTEALVADLMELDEIIVPRVAYDTANEGATASLGYMWPEKTGFLAYRPPISTDEYGRVVSEVIAPAAGRTVMWTGADDATGGVRVQTVPVPAGVSPLGRGTDGGDNVIATAWYKPIAFEVLSAARLTALLA